MNKPPSEPVTRAFLVGEDLRAEGVRLSCYRCPIAIAVARAFDYDQARVFGDGSVQGWIGGRAVALGRLGAVAVRWVQLYDCGEEVGDLAITLTMEPLT
jgi:hypothetical protein